MFHSGLLQWGCFSLIAAEWQKIRLIMFKGCEYFYFIIIFSLFFFFPVGLIPKWYHLHQSIQGAITLLLIIIHPAAKPGSRSS